MASEVIEELAKSADVVDREVARALLKWQESKASRGLATSLDYEPMEIREKGAVAVIESHVLKGSYGFEEADKGASYEAIVNRHPERFRDEVVIAARRRLQNNKYDGPQLTSDDIRFIASSRAKQRYVDLTDREHTAYVRVSRALQSLGDLLKSKLPNSDKFEVRLTSGFNITSGVRSYIPKDLWFSVSPRDNARQLAGMPQLFMIVSERGIEYGYGASVSPSDFSQKTVKEIVRKAAPIVFECLPPSDSVEATHIQDDIDASGGWYYRRKHRLPPNQREFPTLKDWLRYLQSPDGKKNAAGTISRYLQLDKIDGTDLQGEIAEMSRIFAPLIDRVWQSSPEKDEPAQAVTTQYADEKEINLGDSMDFSERLSEFLRYYGEKRTGPFAVDEELKRAMRNLQRWLENVPAVACRPTIKVKFGVGQGRWTKTPWIALLDDRETTTTQRGTYIVFVIAEDLSNTYLTLNQGMTELRNRLGQRGAADEMVRAAEATRPLISELRAAGFRLDNHIALHSDTDAAKNYEIGTIAHVSLPSDDLPDDTTVHRHLEALLVAYDHVIEATTVRRDDIHGNELEEPHEEPVEPYGIEDAIVELFIERTELERYLEIWRNKMNLILQGAPGVGKSFIARRLSYTLIGCRDDNKVQTVQFHQSYSYEDFVQGYRPNLRQGFELRYGTFYEFRNRAMNDPDNRYVFIIDEINRGNLSKIFGELMLLIEPDKRGQAWKTRLTYATDDDPEFFVPENLFILGLMNTADRSLSLVDYALRRRFAFVAMEPLYGAPQFRTHLEAQGVSDEVINRITIGMGELNEAIASDRMNLGPGFRIGHSFFTPTKPVADPEVWYRRVIETEIYPLLEEYWFDAPETADRWRDYLLR